MTARFLELLDLLDLSVERSVGVVPDEVRAAASETAENVRSRSGFVGDVFVMAIAGGTGSGKSSVLNALAGEEIASVSRIRPHSDEATAWIPDGVDVDLASLLDELDVRRRVTNTVFPGLALIDLPDLDSIADWHRSLVEQLLPRVDAVLWVFDPVKYHDPGLHGAFLAPLASYQDQFIFVLNQIDRLGPDELELVEAHLNGILDLDGFAGAETLPIAARPPVGEPRGLEALHARLAAAGDAKARVIAKMTLDVRAAVVDLAGPARLWTGNESGYTGTDGIRGHTTPDITAEVGGVTAARIEEALNADDGDHVERNVLDALWDRGYLGATIASVGVAVAEQLGRAVKAL